MRFRAMYRAIPDLLGHVSSAFYRAANAISAEERALIAFNRARHDEWLDRQLASSDGEEPPTYFEEITLWQRQPTLLGYYTMNSHGSARWPSDRVPSRGCQ
jgi:hypothetical protein